MTVFLKEAPVGPRANSTDKKMIIATMVAGLFVFGNAAPVFAQEIKEKTQEKAQSVDAEKNVATISGGAYKSESISRADQVRSKLSLLVPNFDQVSGNIWRGSAPTRQAIQALKASGFKTIIDLRMSGMGTFTEGYNASNAGLHYVHIPLTFSKPPINKVAEFINIASNPVNQPVFIHCRQGADRTGTLIAIMRVTRDNWTFDKAYEEMRAHHFKSWLPNLKNVVAGYATDAKKKDLAVAVRKEQAEESKLTAGKAVASPNNGL